MGRYKKLTMIACAFLTYQIVTAQSSVAATANNDGLMRSEGKIYVVMAVVITILAGLIWYIIRLDRKITKLEKGEQ